MNDPVLAVERFLKQYVDLQRPILLALSGGSDSICLFYCLLACQKKFPFQFHIAHVDHRWRLESQTEAQALQDLAARYHIPFHLCTLDPQALEGNLEAACRQERYQFFAKICQKYVLQGVLVGHQKDDQVETVLKKMLEGSSWIHLGGLSPRKELYGTTIFRPLLSLSKQTIQNWLKKESITPFEDATNQDERFLRARLRQSILPLLNQQFGKQIDSSLIAMSEEAVEISDYLDHQIQPWLNQVFEGPLGLYIDLQDDHPILPIELKQLIRRISERQHLSFPRSLLKQAVEWMIHRKANCPLTLGNQHIWIDRAKMFFPFSDVAWPSSEPVSIQLGVQKIGRWMIEVKEVMSSDHYAATDWREAWLGRCRAVLPLGDYQLGLASSNTPYHARTRTLAKWWNNHQIPAFLSRSLPVIWNNQVICHEFLTGKNLHFLTGNQPALEIHLFYL